MATGIKHETAFRHYLEWRKLKKWERMPETKSDFAHQYDITLRTLEMWDKRIDNPVSTRRINNYNSEEFLKGRTLAIDEALIHACEKGSPKALELFYKLTGRKLIDKSEVDLKIGLSSDEIIRRMLDAEREARERSNGDNQVQGESAVLHESLRLDSGQRGTGDSEVGDVEASGETSGDNSEVARPATP